jgi:ABC-type transport system substrate-binding protein
MASTYWDKLLNARLGRRRAMTAVGATVAGAGLLAACGDDDKSKDSSDGGGSTGAGGSGSAQNGLLTPIKDETSSLTKGGIYKSVLGTPTTLDPHFTGPQTTHCWMCYSQLLRTKPGHMENTDGDIDRELLTSWEVSPDKLTITGKLTQNTKFSPVPPVNGRVVDIQDVLTSWERFKAVSPRRGDLAHDINPSAPIVSMTSPDSQTLVIKLASIYAPILSALSAKFNGTFYTVPKEAADPAVLDLKGTVVGSGPFYMSDWIPGTSTSFRRNPGFNMDSRGLPYIDGADFYALPDYATQLAQFRTGSIHDQYGNFLQQDI